MAFATPMPLWLLLGLLSAFALGLGTTFPVSVVSIQNAVARAQVGTATGAMNFFRALMASFMVAAFTTILLMALGGQVPSAGAHGEALSNVAPAEMIAAFRYVFIATAALLGSAALCLVMMEERALAGPAIEQAAELAE